MKKAVMYGGGNIGRGFIGELLNRSGYETVFVNRRESVVKQFQQDGRYPVRHVTSDGYDDYIVEND